MVSARSRSRYCTNWNFHRHEQPAVRRIAKFETMGAAVKLPQPRLGIRQADAPARGPVAVARQLQAGAVVLDLHPQKAVDPPRTNLNMSRCRAHYHGEFNGILDDGLQDQ